MTDTAVPLPEITTELQETESMLTPDQLRRVEALRIARQVLENKPGLFAGPKVPDGRAVWELTTLADWILDGSSLPDGDETIDIVNGAGEHVASIPVRPYANEADTFNNPTQESFDSV